MKEGLRSGSVAAQLEKGNGPSSRVICRRRGNEVINSGDLVSEEKGLNSNDQRCPLVISSDLEANGESKENATVPLPVQSVKVECECEEVGKPGQRGRKRGRKSKSECGEGGIGDWKKVESSLECKVEVVGRVLRSKTMAMQAIQTEKHGSGKVVDFEQSESNMVGQSDSGSPHYDKKRVKIEEDESDESAGGSRKKLKGKRGRPVLVKRKRGRPPKEQGKNVMLERVLDKKEKASGSEKGKRKRKRGRPPKVKGENVVLKRVVVKKKEASGSKRNMRASKFKDIVKWNGPNSHIGRESSRISLTEKNKSHELGIQEYETSSAVRSKGVGAFGFREGKKKGKKAKHKKGESGDRRATEKQLVREQIIDMLMRAGWTIDYRPRRDKEYNDAVYKSPMGRGYWSVTLAYNVLKSHYEDGHCEPGFTFTPLPDGVLTKLKRNACKGKRRRLKSEQEYDSGGEMKCCIVKKKSGKNKNAGGKSSNRKMKGKSSLSGQDNLTGTLHKVSSVRNRKLPRTQNTKRFALLARSSKEGLTADIDGYAPYSGKRTLLSWMIDLGTVPLNAKVQYMNRRKTRALLEGWISRDGICCGCCSEILSISKFEIHAGVKLCEPSQNIILETGISLLQCQLDSWNKQKESERSGFHLVDVGADDPNDDTCGICGDGGDLVCCDGCPSTFHQSCLDIQKFPSGDWHCIYCSCKFCGMFSGNTDRMNYNSALLTCHLCEEKYHHMCTQGEDAILDDASSPSFCGKTCREVFEHLQMLLGVKHELEEGFSWTLVQRTEVGLDISLNGIPQKVECNSKLAVALSIMDECFLPIVDQRSGINLIHNVLYNCGSNFNRLNYSGFFTAILERGEEIISAASIRIHGNKLAEMPFIGTRHIYRRQGMCRRLLNAIEYALRSLNVEKLVIPAISELMQTWTSVFGFKPLEVSSRKEMRNMNMLVFHGTDMLQKPLLKDQLAEESMIPSAVLESHELRKDLDIKHGVANNSDRTCSPGSDFNIPSKGANHVHAILDEPAAVESGSQLNEGSLNDLSDITSETTNFPESANEEKNLVHDNLEGKNRTFICPQASACDARALNAHCGIEEIDEHQTAVDDSIILAPGVRTVEPGVSCIGSEATGCEKEVFHSSKEGKETIGCELKNDGGITKQSKDSLENDINPQLLDVDSLHGSGENTACLDFEARNQMSDDANNDEHNDSQQLQVIGYEHNDSQQLQVIGYTLDADDKVLNTLKAKDEVVVVDQKPGAYPTSTQCCSEILCQSCNSSNDALSHLMPPLTLQKVRDVANDSCAALLVGCDLESSCQGDGLDSHKLEYVSASLDTNCQPSDAATKPNEHHQSIELASGLDKNDIPESETCAFTSPVGMSHQTASKLTGDVVHNPKESLKASQTSLSSHDDGFPPDRPQTVIESDSVADHSSSGSGMALLCASGGCKAGGAPEVMIVSNQAS